MLERQAKQHGNLVRAFPKHRHHISLEPSWDVTDADSRRQPGSPLLFGSGWRPKPAFHAVIAEAEKVSNTQSDRLPPYGQLRLAEPRPGGCGSANSGLDSLPVHPALHTVTVPSGTGLRPRLQGVDLLRGLVMVLMALDHSRDFFTGVSYYPLDLKQTFPALFVTRWITHLCAPTFVFLAGTGAFLASTRGKTTRELSRYLLTRGLWLVLLELTIVHWSWSFEVSFRTYGIQVIWVIGWSMVVLAGLVWLPGWAVLAFGLVMIALHNTLDGVTPGSFGAWSGLWRVLHTGGVMHPVPSVMMGVGYPLVPWMGVMAAGYAIGPVLLREPAPRRQWLLRMGAALAVLFVVIRASNLYGDPKPWSPQKNLLFTAFSFVDCEKYPPSLCFLLMTLGPALLLLACFDGLESPLLKPMLVFGRVPLFFYLLHLPLIHGLSVAADFVFARRPFVSTGFSPEDAGVVEPAHVGLRLIGVYVLWLVVLAVLYPACRWFAEVKRTRRKALLSYL